MRDKELDTLGRLRIQVDEVGRIGARAESRRPWNTDRSSASYTLRIVSWTIIGVSIWFAGVVWLALQGR